MEARASGAYWTGVLGVLAGFMGSLGAGFFSVVPRANGVLRYVERARAVRGEIQPVFRGNGVLKQMAFPEPGWYDIDLAEHAG